MSAVSSEVNGSPAVDINISTIRLTGESDISINSVEELLSLLGALSRTAGGDLWFRGQSMYDWPLTPGLFRLEGQVSESTLLLRFKQSAAQLIATAPKESYDWMFLMQHYGLPTRLLDWSESPLIGLYFAIENAIHHSDDGALWILNPIELNLISKIQSNKESFFIPSFEEDVLSSYTIESVRSQQNLTLRPVAIIATRNNPRIQAQLGVFTVHHTKEETIENASVGAPPFLKVKIPASAKESLKKQLSMLGYSRFQVFPELSSISDVIKERML